MTSCAICSRSDRLSTPPVGLAGEFKINMRVLGVISLSRSLRSKAKFALHLQRNRHGARADKVDHAFVDRKAGIGIDDFFALVDQRHDGKEDDRLAAGHHHHVIGRHVDFARAVDVVRDGRAQFGNARRRRIMRAVVVQGVHGFVDDVLRRVEVGFADFEMDDVAPQFLQRLGARAALQRRFPCRGGSCGMRVSSDCSLQGFDA